MLDAFGNFCNAELKNRAFDVEFHGIELTVERGKYTDFDIIN